MGEDAGPWQAPRARINRLSALGVIYAMIGAVASRPALPPSPLKMPRSVLLLAFATFAAWGICAAAEPLDSLLPLDSEIQRILDDRVVTYQDSVGLVVGVITPQSRKIFARGTYDVGDDAKVDGDTIFEIGSVSKIFTALLLADMARRGEASPSDPVAKYLPAGTKLPERGRAMTLLDLATHTSGLPGSASNVLIIDLNNPNKELSAEQLYRFLAGYELNREVGSAYAFSNVGYAILGLALADRSKLEFQDLLRARIFDPLHMNSTRIVLPIDFKDRLTIGHDEHLRAVPSTQIPKLLGSDSVRSSADDLLNFVAANLGYVNSPLGAAMADMLKVRRPTDYAQRQVALGWHVVTLHDTEIVWQNGQTAGYRAFVGFVPKTRVGVVVLSNAVNTIDDIGVHLLDPKHRSGTYTGKSQ